MKHRSTFFVWIIILIACNHPVENKNILIDDSRRTALGICDCFTQANTVMEEPARTEAQNNCIKIETDLRKKFQDSTVLSIVFNKALDSCTQEMLNTRLK